MSKYTLKIQVQYELVGDLLKEYNEWRDDHDDTQPMRYAFMSDRFITDNALSQIDPNAVFSVLTDGGE